jgi:hypothetical protein
VTLVARCARVGLVLIAAVSTPGAAQDVDSSLARIERLVTAGDRAAARPLVDSVFAMMTPLPRQNGITCASPSNIR